MTELMKRKTNFHGYSNIQERMNIPISYVKGAKSNKILGAGRLIEVFQKMKESTEIKSLDDKLSTALSKGKAEYSKIKEKECPGFIIGSYDVRKDSACKEYIPLIGFDIDKVEDFFSVKAILADCKESPFIFAAFPSPSKIGVRIFMWCGSTSETHKTYYKKATEYLSSFLNIPTDKQVTADLKSKGKDRAYIKDHLSKNVHIDSSTSNISRIWFFTHTLDEDIFLNAESEVFSDDEKISIERPLPLSLSASNLSMSEKFEAIEKMTDSRDNGSGRNNRLLLLCCLLNEHGVIKSDIADYCLRYEEDGFGLDEIEKVINNAVSRSTFGKFSDQQLRNYLSKSNSENIAQAKTQTPSLQESKNDKVIVPGQEENHFNGSNDEDNDYGEKPKITKIRERVFNNYDIRLNTIAIELEYRRKGSKNWMQLNENDLIVELLEAKFKGVEGPLMALLRSSYIPKYDPITDYFSNLPEWDNTQPDYIHELGTYVDSKDNDWFQLQFKKMLVRLVACAINLIPFNKHAFTFVGKQNDGKTTFIRFLCPPPLKNYFKENLDIHNKDGRLALCQNVIINLDELATFSKFDINKTKAFFTIDKIKERLPYDRKSSTFQRRASFFASTNSSEFLTDETGNVRWLIFEIRNINHDNGGAKGYVKNVDINKVYAQAYSLLRNGFDFKLSKDDIFKSEKNNKQFQVINIEQELIQDIFMPGENIKDCNFVTHGDIHSILTDRTKAKITSYKIGKAMKMHGFNQAQQYWKKVKSQRKGYYVKVLDPIVLERIVLLENDRQLIGL